MTTFNVELPDEQWRIPQPHPSAVRPSAVEDADADADYYRLVNSVERQTRCSSACYFRQKNVSVPAKCRFGLPKGLEEETHFNYELLPHRNICAKLVTKKNDHRLNSHNRVMLENIGELMLIYRSSLTRTHVHGTWQSMQQRANHAQSKHQRFWDPVCQGYRIMIKYLRLSRKP